jgi:cytochrome c-type biogenesis protein CcmH
MSLAAMPAIRAALLGLALLSAPGLADSTMPAAKWANEQLPDAGQEAKARDLMLTIRCIVCQGQSIADSDAELAGDMRSLVRTRIAQGETPDQIKQWLIDRYGAFITYEPPLAPITWPLWLAPLLLLAVGVVLARGRFRKRR